METPEEESERDIIPEDEAGSPADIEDDEQGPAALKKLREKLKKAIEEKQEYLDGWQRARADFTNYKRQEASLLEQKEARLKADIIEALLPALDTLELSLKHHPNDTTLPMIEKQFLDSLKRLGVEKVGAAGEEFDPNRHEALAKQTEEHKVISVERSGYKVGDTIIRPAQVII